MEKKNEKNRTKENKIGREIGRKQRDSGDG